MRHFYAKMSFRATTNYATHTSTNTQPAPLTITMPAAADGGSNWAQPNGGAISGLSSFLEAKATAHSATQSWCERNQQQHMIMSVCVATKITINALAVVWTSDGSGSFNKRITEQPHCNSVSRKRNDIFRSPLTKCLSIHGDELESNAVESVRKSADDYINKKG